MHLHVRAGRMRNKNPAMRGFECYPSKDWDCFGIRVTVKDRSSDAAKVTIAALSALPVRFNVQLATDKRDADLVEVWVSKAPDWQGWGPSTAPRRRFANVLASLRMTIALRAAARWVWAADSRGRLSPHEATRPPTQSKAAGRSSRTETGLRQAKSRFLTGLASGSE